MYPQSEAVPPAQAVPRSHQRVPFAPQIIHEVLARPGVPLASEVNGAARDRFGHDFSHVRVHADGAAARSADAVQASAYTIGSHVVFAAGRYAPDSVDGRRRLWHELTHIVQQAGTGPQGRAPLPIAGVDAAERQAREVGTGTARSPVGVDVTPSRAAGPSLQRQEAADESKIRGVDSDDDKIRQSLGLAPASPAGVRWLGEPPSSLHADPGTNVHWLGGGPSPGLKGAIDADLHKQPKKLPPVPGRTPFEARAYSLGLRRIHDPKTGSMIGFFNVEGGVYKVYDINGNATIVGEARLESPLIDPIDLIPVELLASLSAKASVALGRAGLKALGRAAVEDVAKGGVELATKTGVEAGTGKLITDQATREAGSLSASGAASVERDEFAEFQKMLQQEGASGEVSSGELTQLQPHGRAPQYRKVQGVTGEKVQSAHVAPQSVMKGVPGYNPRSALTRLMQRDVHTGMDRYWKQSFDQMLRAGRTKATAQTIHDVVAESIRAAPGLSEGAKTSLVARLTDEMFVEYGLNPTDLLDLRN